jgi:hypothetical protein
VDKWRVVQNVVRIIKYSEEASHYKWYDMTTNLGYGVILVKKHAMVVGGTGMLKSATIWLEENGYHVSAVARTRTGLESVKEQAGNPANLSIYSVDYHDEVMFAETIKSVISENGPIDLVLVWIHSSAPYAFPLLVQTIEKEQNSGWQLYHVKGSTKQIPTDVPELPEKCNYHQIFLGFIIEMGWSRWLTHQEISNGTIEGIKGNKPIHIVGTLEPWDMRP